MVAHCLQTTLVVSKIAQAHFDAHIDTYSCEFGHCRIVRRSERLELFVLSAMETTTLPYWMSAR